MTDLRSKDTIGDDLTRKSTDGLAEYVTGLVHRWEQTRDVEYRAKWSEYRRMWMGEWAPQDRDKTSERSRAIMPAIQQAVDSAVSEVEEAVFGQERWFDFATDNPSTEVDEGGPGRVVADQLLADLANIKSAVSETVLLGAVYGTGIAKILMHDGPAGEIRLELVPTLPNEFVIEPGARSIQEAEGCAHVFHLPYNVVLERQRQGVYEQVDPGIGADPQVQYEIGKDRYADAMLVRMIEYQGLVPASMIPEEDDGREKLDFEDEKPIEAIVTIANDNVVLRAVRNPLTNRDRGFIAFQWDTVPGRFYGRGIVEKGYWPQKVLDAEVRARIDALGFSTMPMIAMNAAAVPRGASFEVRPGRNIFLNGSPGENIAPLRFPPPDPQTYTQGQEMQRMIEMATGQLQAATPFGVNGRNETASGMSMMLGASIRRTRRTMANFERTFLRPLLAKSLDRMMQFDERYNSADLMEGMPEGAGKLRFQVKGTLGMMAREFESMQLGQLLNAMPPGPAQFMLLRSVVDNMALAGRQDLLRLLDLLTAQSMEPAEPERDLSGEARILSVQLRERELDFEEKLREANLMLERSKLELQARTAEDTDKRELMRLAIDAERADSDEVAKTSKAILDLAKAEAEELGSQLTQYAEAVSKIRIDPPKPSAPGEAAPSLDIDAIKAQIVEELRDSIEMNVSGGVDNDDIAPIQIERDSNGLITAVNGRQVQRDGNGLVMGLQ